MKTVTVLALCFVSHVCLGLPRSVEEKKALMSGAETRIVFCVVDNEGFAVTNALVKVGFYLNEKKGNAVSGLTDTNGLLFAEKRSVGEVNYWIRKSGYYETSGLLQCLRQGRCGNRFGKCHKQRDNCLSAGRRMVRNASRRCDKSLRKLEFANIGQLGRPVDTTYRQERRLRRLVRSSCSLSNRNAYF